MSVKEIDSCIYLPMFEFHSHRCPPDGCENAKVKQVEVSFPYL